MGLITPPLSIDASENAPAAGGVGALWCAPSGGDAVPDRTSAEGICVINKSEESKVLATCRPGQYCRVNGVIDICKDSGECKEVTQVGLVAPFAEEIYHTYAPCEKILDEAMRHRWFCKGVGTGLTECIKDRRHISFDWAPRDVCKISASKGRGPVDAKITAGAAGRVSATGTAPLAAGGKLDLALNGNLDAGIANRAMAAAGRRVAGTIAIDARVAGTLDRPKVSGSAILANGSDQDAASGTRLDAVRARFVARDDQITIESASATASNGGTVIVSGDVRLEPTGGFPSRSLVNARRSSAARLPPPSWTSTSR
jgi:hypothetical protein